MRKHRNVALAIAIALAATARAASAAEARPALEVVETDAGPRVLFLGVGVGTKYERAAERLGGDPMGAFFGTPGSIVKSLRVDGVPCDLMVDVRDGRVSGMTFWCRGEREDLEALTDAIANVLLDVPAEVMDGTVAWVHGDDLVASLRAEREGSGHLLVFIVFG